MAICRIRVTSCDDDVQINSCHVQDRSGALPYRRCMNLRQLRYVVATADHGTMTAAAQALFVAQPALSRAIRELERELGIELFARAGRGVALTESGEQIVRYARDALRAVDAIEAFSATPSGGRPGELRVAATSTVEPELTARLLPEVAREQP